MIDRGQASNHLFLIT